MKKINLDLAKISLNKEKIGGLDSLKIVGGATGGCGYTVRTITTAGGMMATGGCGPTVRTIITAQ